MLSGQMKAEADDRSELYGLFERAKLPWVTNAVAPGLEGEVTDRELNDEVNASGSAYIIM